MSSLLEQSDRFLAFVAKNHLGDAASIVGLIITCFTFWVADRARKAAETAKEHVLRFEATADVARAIAILEETKNLHRRKELWLLLPEKYTAVRKILISLRDGSPKPKKEELTRIQNAVATLLSFEEAVEEALRKYGEPLDSARLNRLTCRQIDDLTTTLMTLRARVD